MLTHCRLSLLRLSKFFFLPFDSFLLSFRNDSRKDAKNCGNDRKLTNRGREREGKREEPCEDEYMKSPVHGIRYIES